MLYNLDICTPYRVQSTDSIAIQGMRGSKRLRIRHGGIDVKATYEVISAGSKGNMPKLTLNYGDP